jgi:hypothetical protein
MERSFEFGWSAKIAPTGYRYGTSTWMDRWLVIGDRHLHFEILKSVKSTNAVAIDSIHQ